MLRNHYAILAADRFYCKGNPAAPDTVGYARKIVAHSTLPLAIAIGGMGELKDDENPHPEIGIPVAELLRKRVFPKIDKHHDLLHPTLEELVQSVMLPLVRNHLRQEEVFPKAKRSCGYVDLVMAIGERGNAGLVWLRLADVVRQQSDGADVALGPDPVQGYFDGMVQGKLFGLALMDQRELCEHAVGVVREAIRIEAAAYGGVNRECGGSVDCAVIDRVGVKECFARAGP
jgi:hypothetical protein